MAIRTMSSELVSEVRDEIEEAVDLEFGGELDVEIWTAKIDERTQTATLTVTLRPVAAGR